MINPDLFDIFGGILCFDVLANRLEYFQLVYLFCL